MMKKKLRGGIFFEQGSLVTPNSTLVAAICTVFLLGLIHIPIVLFTFLIDRRSF